MVNRFEKLLIMRSLITQARNFHHPKYSCHFPQRKTMTCLKQSRPHFVREVPTSIIAKFQKRGGKFQPITTEIMTALQEPREYA